MDEQFAPGKTLLQKGHIQKVAAGTGNLGRAQILSNHAETQDNQSPTEIEGMSKATRMISVST